MSRGPVARSDAIGEQLPGSVITLARIDLRAQNHATAEGAADPYPNPRQTTPAPHPQRDTGGCPPPYTPSETTHQIGTPRMRVGRTPVSSVSAQSPPSADRRYE